MSACPVNEGKGGNDGCPMKQKNGSTYRSSHEYNVYSEVIDPNNQMPANPNQLPAKGQRVPLSTHRESSKIPKGGAMNDEATWLYPSPQMFWNALVRKNKEEGANEDDMEMVVAVHNNMNERTWQEVIKWEKLKGSGMEFGGPPKLLRFQGKPHDLSPKARLKMFFGHPAPFDRHDWWIDQGGRLNRYVIDYYHDQSIVKEDEAPKNKSDFSSMKSIKIDVRPAMFDNMFGLLSRVFLMPFNRYMGTTDFKPLPFFPPKAMATAEVEKVKELSVKWSTIRESCKQVKEDMRFKCEKAATEPNEANEAACASSSVALQRCIAGIVCPDVAKAFDEAVSTNNNELAMSGYANIHKCLDFFEVESRSNGVGANNVSK